MRPRLILLGLAACLPAISLIPAGQAQAGAVASFGHVFVIVGENTPLSQINSANAPYITGTLKPRSAWLTGYHDVTAGSLADYVALTSGQYAPCQTHGPCGIFAVPSIFAQLGNGAWRDWNESMPSPCNRSPAGSDAALNPYKPGHNPALFYAGLPCQAGDVPAGTTGPDDMTWFNQALAAGTVPAYNFIAPNLCQDGHDSCHGADTVTEYDHFLAREIPLIQASPAFGPDGVIFATYDEGPGTIMMAVTGPQVKPGTYPGSYDHYSTLRTIEQGLGLPSLANAAKANTLPVFG